jgi:hypothetical protein
MRSNLPLFLSSSVVERSAVNRLVVGSNPTWGDLIDSELTNSGLTLTVKSREPVPCLCFYLIVSHSVLRDLQRQYLGVGPGYSFAA